MEALSVEELALQRIFDLKSEVVLEFESHQRFFDEALLSNVFLKGLDPPPWLFVDGNKGEIPVLLSRRPSCSAFRIGSDGKRVHRQDSVNRDFSKQERFSELYRDFLCNRKRTSSSVDRPSCYEAAAAKKPRVEESGFVGAREIDGDRGRELGLDALEEEKGEEQGFEDAQHGENEERRDLVDEKGEEQGFEDAQHGENEKIPEFVDVQHGGNEGGERFFEAQLGRNEKNDVKQEENVEGVEKLVKGRSRGRGAKEKKTNAVSPFVGRITRSRAKQCQVLLSARKDIDKRRSAAKPKQPRGTRRNARAKGAAGLEVSEEPKDVIELAVTEPHVVGKSSPLMNVFGIENHLPESPPKTKSQSQNKASPVAESQVEAKLSPRMTELQNEDHSSPVMNNLQIEDNARRDDIGRTEGTAVKESEANSASVEAGRGGFKDIDHKSDQQVDTPEMLERCTEEAVPRDDCRRSAGSCDAEELEASNVTETDQKQDTLFAIENAQLHEISDLTESTQVQLTEEERPMGFHIQRKDNLSPVEEGAEGRMSTVLRPFENQKSMDTMPIDTTLVSNTTCTPQEMRAFTFSSKVDLLADNMRSSLSLVQETPSNPHYSGKSGLSDASRPSRRTELLERLVFCGEGSHPISDNVNLLGNGLVQEVPDSPLVGNSLVQEVPDSPLVGNSLVQEVPDSLPVEGTGHGLSMKANASDMIVTDAPLRNEREDTDAIGIGPGKVSICPNEKTPGNVLIQEVPESPLLGNRLARPLLGNGLVQEVPDSRSIEEAGHELSMEAIATDMAVADVLLRNEREDTDAIGKRLGKNFIYPIEKISDQGEPEIALYEERDIHEKVKSYSNAGFIHGRTVSFDSAQGLSCYNLHKSGADITQDLTNKLRNRSMDFCKNILGKETNNCSNIVVNAGGQDCLKAVSFSRLRSLSGSSVRLPSQSNEGQNLKRARSASPVDVSATGPSGGEENEVLQMPEDMDFMTSEIDESFVCPQKSRDSQGKIGAHDSVLVISSQDEAAKGQLETLHNAPSKKLPDADIDFIDRTLLSCGKLFSRNMGGVKEEGGMKLQHNSWPKYQKRSSQVQQQFHSVGQSRLWRTESCSKVLDYETSIRLSNGGIEVMSSDAGDICQCDGVAKSCASDSKRNGDMENTEPRHDNMVNVHLLQDFSSLGSNNSEAFPDQPRSSLLSSQINKDVEQSLGDNEHQRRAKLILEECSTRMGLYPRQSLTALGERKCRIGNENVRRSSPSCLSYSTYNEGAFAYIGSSQVRVDGMHFQATNNNTAPACLQGQVHLHAAPLKSCSFRSSFEVTSPQNHGTEGDCKLLPEDDAVSDFSFQKGVSGMENNDMESTPLLKGGVVRERAQCSLAKSLLVNQKPFNQLKSAGLESHENFSDEVDVSISEISERKKRPSLEVDCQPKVNSSISGLAKGAAGSLGMLQLVQPSCSFSSTNQTVDSVAYDNLFQSMQLASLHDVKMLQEFEGFNNGLLYKDNNFKSGKGNECVEIDMEYERIGDKNGKYSSTKEGVNSTELCKAFHSLTPGPNHISKCKTLVPLNACSSHAMGLQEHKESPGEYPGKRYAINDSYMAAHGLPTDKFQTRSGFDGVGGCGLKIKNSPSLTPAGGTFFERISKNSMNMDSKSFPRKVHMFKGHSGCFPIEEENSVEEESMDHPISLKRFTNRSGSSSKKSVLGAKKILMDSSSARHNSQVTTPTGGKLFERISTNYTDTGSNLLPKKAYLNQNNDNCFNNEEEVGLEKENREPSVSVNEFQKNYGSSVKKKVLRDHNTEAYSSNASHISPAKNKQKSNNLLSNVRSFIPLVQQKPAAASIMTGKRDVKVKALEVAEVAKRMEEKKEHERKMRKELARRGEHEKNFQEKPKEERNRGEKEGEETIRATSDCSNKSISNGVVRKKPVGCALPKSHAENSSQLDTSAYGVDLKLKRALEAKTKLEQEKVRKLEEEQRRKEEERKKKEAELAAKKRKREEIERRDREEKRKRLEEAHRQQKETEEQLRADKEVKEQRRRALDEYERKRKAMEEEAKKQRRIEKEKEAAERRRRLEEDAKSIKFTLKDAKHLEETHQQHEATHEAHKANAGKVSSMCNNFSKSKHETEGQSMPGINKKLLQSIEPDINIQSYDISPYKGSDEEDDDEDAAPGKFIPLWARKENLIQHLTSQQYIDPDEIFTGAKTCSLNEVFGTNGSLRRTDFNRRSKSGEWLADKFTWKEEYQYKLQMGYINKG